MPSTERPQNPQPKKRLKSFRKGQRVSVMGIEARVVSKDGDWINLVLGENKVEARVHRDHL
jgi:preprotein translocase subunit YajC